MGGVACCAAVAEPTAEHVTAEKQQPSMQQPPSQLSARGVAAARSPVRDDLDKFAAGVPLQYHPEERPDGYLLFNVAENKLSWPDLREKFAEVAKEAPLPDWVAAYGNTNGQDLFRRNVAAFAERTWIHSPVDPACLAMQPGCSAVLDSLAWSLCEAGDACILPGPIYSAFPMDFYAKARVHLEVAPTTAETSYEPREEDLVAAHARCVSSGFRPRVLLLCNPVNPTGTLYSRSSLEICLDWAQNNGLHVISDEVYANSLFPGETMLSVATLMRERNPKTAAYLGEKVHIVAGFSKDFGLSGLRVGMLFSHNEELLTALKNLGLFTTVSHVTQHWLTRVLEDSAWVDAYIAKNRKRLYACYQGLQEALNGIGVDLFPCQGTLMAWADFRHLLKEPSWEAETQLWNELFDEHRVLLTTGRSCRAHAPGYFRICYAYPAVGDSGDEQVAMRELRRRLLDKFGAKSK